jgi:hypothetical protein
MIHRLRTGAGGFGHRVSLRPGIQRLHLRPGSERSLAKLHRQKNRVIQSKVRYALTCKRWVEIEVMIPTEPLFHASQLHAGRVVVMIKVSTVEFIYLGDEWRFERQFAVCSVLGRIYYDDGFLAERLYVVVVEGTIWQGEG